MCLGPEETGDFVAFSPTSTNPTETNCSFAGGIGKLRHGELRFVMLIRV